MVSAKKKRSTATTYVADEDGVLVLAKKPGPEGNINSTNSMDDPCSVVNKKQKLETKAKTKTKPSPSNQNKEDKEDMAWICAECKEAECGLVGADDSADLLLCDGPCHRIFHIPCAGLTAAPSTDDDAHIAVSMERTTSVSFRAKKINVTCSSARHASTFIMSIMIIHSQPAKTLKKIAITRMKWRETLRVIWTISIWVIL
uniref:PHD-type domain-containing protein n=1 Tax=Pseudo-nitzschia australis TaxID=44445 RepID=A0A7S4EMD7_9STRA